MVLDLLSLSLEVRMPVEKLLSWVLPVSAAGFLITGFAYSLATSAEDFFFGSVLTIFFIGTLFGAYVRQKALGSTGAPLPKEKPTILRPDPPVKPKLVRGTVYRLEEVADTPNMVHVESSTDGYIGKISKPSVFSKPDRYRWNGTGWEEQYKTSEFTAGVD